MEQKKLDRINELAKIAKSRALTTGELAERQKLREEYIAAYKNSLVAQLENTYIIDKYGHKTKVQKKQEKQ